MDGQKFEIEGKIENKGNKNATIIGRFFLFLLVVICVSAIWYFPFLQEAFPSLRKITIGAPVADTTNTITITQLKKTRDSLKTIADSLQTANAFLVSAAQNFDDNSGLYYHIQIGVFDEFDLKKYQDGLKALHAEVAADGKQKLLLGKFKELKLAKDFLKEVKKIGFKDAWIVAKENGERVPFENTP